VKKKLKLFVAYIEILFNYDLKILYLKMFRYSQLMMIIVCCIIIYLYSSVGNIFCFQYYILLDLLVCSTKGMQDYHSLIKLEV